MILKMHDLEILNKENQKIEAGMIANVIS